MQAETTSKDPTKSTMARRVGAYVVDWMAIFAIAAIWFNSLASQTDVQRSSDGIEWMTVGGQYVIHWNETVYVISSGSLWSTFLVFALAWVAIRVIWQGKSGTTVGKSLFGLRTIASDGNPPGTQKAAVREAILFVAALPNLRFLGLILEFGVAMASSGNQRIGDKAAGTYVVHKAAMGSPMMPGAGAAPPAPGSAPVVQPPPSPAPGTLPAGQDAVTQAETTPANTTASAADPSQPQWDAARNAYIAWDATAQRWQQFDDASQEWRPIG